MSVRGKALHLLPLDLLLEMHPLHNKASCILFPQASDSDRQTDRDRVCVCMDLKLMGLNFNFKINRETFGQSLG